MSSFKWKATMSKKLLFICQEKKLFNDNTCTISRLTSKVNNSVWKLLTMDFLETLCDSNFSVHTDSGKCRKAKAYSRALCVIKWYELVWIFLSLLKHICTHLYQRRLAERKSQFRLSSEWRQHNLNRRTDRNRQRDETLLRGEILLLLMLWIARWDKKTHTLPHIGVW